MALDLCKKCGKVTEAGHYPDWVLPTCLLFWPIGIAGIFMGKEPTICNECARISKNFSSRIRPSEPSLLWKLLKTSLLGILLVVILTGILLAAIETLLTFCS
jgi:hypothetical protein